jgi:hypothetical protein
MSFLTSNEGCVVPRYQGDSEQLPMRSDWRAGTDNYLRQANQGK